MSVTPSPIAGFAGQFFDNNGQPLSGGKIYTYAAGTTTPQATYTSALGVAPHANPIVLDSAGRVPGGEIWLTDGLVYKFVIETSTNVLIGTYDNIIGVNSNFVNYTVQEEVITATAGQTVFNLTTINYTPGTNSLSVYIDGVNQYVGDSYLETDSDTVTFTAGLHVGAEVKFTTAIQTTTGAVDASIVSYTPPFTGSVGTTVEDKLAQYVSVKDFGAVGNGIANDTAAIQAALNAAPNVYVPAGTYMVNGLTLNTENSVVGDGFGATVFKLRNGANASVFQNADTVAGNPNIKLSNFSVDGNYTNQTSTVHGVIFTKCNSPYFDVEIYNCRGTGIVLSGGSGASTSNRNTCYSNGIAAAGYGFYVFNHDRATVYGYYHDNCIGVAIEASGTGTTASGCRVSVTANDNRADFGQSGAGVHWEQSSGGSADDGIAIGCVCTNSTGVGINNTACNLTIIGGVVSGNTKSGVITSAAQNFLYTGIKMLDNGAGDAVGYQTSMRFDDSGLNPASVGEVIGCYATGSTIDGYKTLSVNSAVTFTNNYASGFTNDYVLTSANDVVSRLREKGSFTATLTGVSGTVTGAVNYDLNGDIVTLTIPTAINGTSADTNAPTLTGMPAAIRPSVNQRDVGVATNNSANVLSWVDVSTSGVLTFFNGTSGTFAATGTKGAQQCQIVYRLT